LLSLLIVLSSTGLVHGDEMAALRGLRAALSGPRAKLAIAGGVALTAYVTHTAHQVHAAEPASSQIFVINGFYMAMREKFTKPGSSIYYYLVEWEPAKLSWEDFRGKVLGATDPSTAAPGSLRKEIFSQWKGLGLAAEPNVGDNGVHASASPFEALAERLNWMGATLEDDPFGKAMLASGIPKDTIMAWTKDPQVPFEGKKASLFDLLEDLDYDECLSKAQAIAGVSGKRPSGKMQAYVFIKPHAVTDQTKKMVASRFAEVGVTVYKQGSLDAAIIEKDKLIDNHYYAIANKASLSKPAELNPPAPKQEEFEKKFGISWKAALAKGIVFNAVDGCARLGIDGAVMDKTWASAKKAGDLVKFGGGFYAGRIPVPKDESSSSFLSSVVLVVYALLGK
jgi:nucleoside diphosphate kinase